MSLIDQRIDIEIFAEEERGTHLLRLAHATKMLAKAAVALEDATAALPPSKRPHLNRAILALHNARPLNLQSITNAAAAINATIRALAEAPAPPADQPEKFLIPAPPELLSPPWKPTLA